MPKWIERWVKRWEDKFPECAVRCRYSDHYLGYVVEVFYPKHQAWRPCPPEPYCIWGVILNPSHSPAVRQNRLSFRAFADREVRTIVNRVKDKGE